MSILYDGLQKRWITLAVLMLFLCLLTAGIFAQDLPQPFTPLLIESYTPVQDELEDHVTARLYGFNGNEGDTITLLMHSDELDAYLVLFGSAGELLAFNDDGTDRGFDAQITDFELPYTGRYYAMATSYGYIDGLMTDESALPRPLAYELHLSGATPVSLDPSEDAPRLPVATPLTGESPTQAALTAEYPIGFFRLEAQAGDTLDLTLTDSDIMYPMIYVFDPQGGRIAMTGNPDIQPLEEVELTQDGEHLIMVMDTFFMDRLLDNAGDYGLGNVTLRADLR